MTIGFAILLLRSFQMKKKEAKKMQIDNMQRLKKKTEDISIKNKYIATLTHEIKNFVEA